MSDKELDDLFKDASGKMDTPFDASEWQKMEQLLNAKGGVRSAFWNWKTYTSLSLLLLLATTATVVWMNTKKEQTALSSPQELPGQASENKLLAKEPKAEQAGNGNNNETIVNQKEKKETIIQQKNEKNRSVVVQNSIGVKRSEPSKTDNKKKADLLIVYEGDKMNDDNREMVKTDLVNEVVQVNEVSSNNTAIAAVQNESEPSSDSVSALKEDKELAPKDSSEDEASKEEKVKQHFFSIKAALSPDFSSVGYFTPGETGLNYGLMAEYGLGEHFSVLLGGIWSKKLYSSESAEAYGYGQSTNSKKITGDCRILDIPLLVNYYINPGHRFVVYGSAGLSSYIMFKESYNYEVVKNGKSYDYNKTVERKNNEWFKMVNISMGVQYRLTNRWYLQAEPFIKAPLTGIGEGDIKLVSSGVFVNVKYTFK